MKMILKCISNSVSSAKGSLFNPYFEGLRVYSKACMHLLPRIKRGEESIEFMCG